MDTALPIKTQRHPATSTSQKLQPKENSMVDCWRRMMGGRGGGSSRWVAKEQGEPGEGHQVGAVSRDNNEEKVGENPESKIHPEEDWGVAACLAIVPSPAEALGVHSEVSDSEDGEREALLEGGYIVLLSSGWRPPSGNACCSQCRSTGWRWALPSGWRWQSWVRCGHQGCPWPSPWRMCSRERRSQPQQRAKPCWPTRMAVPTKRERVTLVKVVNLWRLEPEWD